MVLTYQSTNWLTKCAHLIGGSRTFWVGHPVDDSELARRIRIELLAIFAGHSIIMGSAILMSTALLAIIFWPNSLTFPAVVCLIGLWLAVLTRMQRWWRHRGRPKPKSVRKITLRRATFWVCVISLLWAILICALFSSAPAAPQIFLVFLCGGLAAGAATTMATLPVAVMVFIFSAMAPAIIGLGFAGGLISWSMMAMSVLFMTFMLLIAQRRYVEVIRSVALQLDLERSRDRLEERVRARTKALEDANDRLKAQIVERQLAEASAKEARVQAETANQTKSDFLAHMSHELRTPLTAIIGFSEVLEGEIFGPLGHQRYQEYIKDIHDSAQHLLDLINDLLDIARIESGRYELEPEAINLAALMPELAEMFTTHLAARDCRINIHVPRDCPPLIADRRAVKQMLMNLISNALKFSQESGTIDLRVIVTEQDLKIIVEDSGIGIKPSDLDSVLHPFSRIKDPAVRGIAGTGLGLSIVKTLIERHGGALVLKSQPGLGTKVTLSFPYSGSKSDAVAMASVVD